MAEIRVERKRGGASWMWLVLLLVVVIAVAVYLWQAGYINLGWAEPTVEDSWRAIMIA
ncbi:MAG TPA: hypothetical protein VGD49_04185 [Longimicrobiales bacterium]